MSTEGEHGVWRLTPCEHFWLEMVRRGERIVALCQRVKCRQRREFSEAEWEREAERGRAKNKPVRL